MEIKNVNTYYIVYHWMQKNLGLKGADLIVYAIIYCFSHDGECEYSGSISYLCELSAMTKKTVISSLERLVDKGYVTKNEYRINNIKFCKYSICLEKLDFFTTGVKITPPKKEKITPNNIVIYNNNFEKEKENKKEKENLVETGDYEVTPSYVTKKAHDAEYWRDEYLKNDTLIERGMMQVKVDCDQLKYLLERFCIYKMSVLGKFFHLEGFVGNFINWCNSVDKEKLLSEYETDMACKEIKELYNDDNAGQVLLDYSKKKNIAISQCLSDFKMAHEKGISLDDLIYYIKTDVRRW